MATAKRKTKKTAAKAHPLQSKLRQAALKLAKFKKDVEKKAKAFRKEIEHKIAQAKTLAYAKGRADEAKETHKRALSREKAASALVARHEKKPKKAKKHTAKARKHKAKRRVKHEKAKEAA